MYRPVQDYPFFASIGLRLSDQNDGQHTPKPLTPSIVPSFAPDPRRKDFNIALAEDEKSVLRVMSNILARAGFLVNRTFANGRDLAEFVEMNQEPDVEPDLIITDLRMPLVDGIEAARQIKKSKPRVKIVLASAYDIPAEHAELFDAVLKKPFGAKDLVRTVSRVLNLEKAD
jgi:CheY-like chemotaxis protein